VSKTNALIAGWLIGIVVGLWIGLQVPRQPVYVEVSVPVDVERLEEAEEIEPERVD